MFKTAARFLLLRVLPRRLIPVVTVVEAVLLIRSVRRRSTVRVNEPTKSRTAPPDAAAVAAPSASPGTSPARTSARSTSARSTR